MSFVKALPHLKRCYDMIGQNGLSQEEREARDEFLELCKDACIEAEECALITEEIVDGILQGYEEIEDDAYGFSEEYLE